MWLTCWLSVATNSPIPMFLTVADLQILMKGVREKTKCYQLYQDIKAHYKREKHQFIQHKHFADYMGVDVDEVYQALGQRIPTQAAEKVR
jgi:hypothetical protein